MPRAVITGLGVVSPIGVSAEKLWNATLAGQCGIAPLPDEGFTRYPTRLAGQVVGIDFAARIPGRLMPQTDRVTRLALVAADAALADACLDPATVGDYDKGVVTGNSYGGFEFTHLEIRKLWTLGPEHVSVYESFAWFYAVNTGQLSIRHGMRGPSTVLVADQAGGLDALGQVRRTIRSGTPVVLGGGLDSAMDPWGWVSQLACGQVSTGHDPATAYLPFDARARGHVPGEGGAILVVEDAGHALDRGAPRTYGEIAGYAATFDPKPGSARPPGLARAIELALLDAGLLPGDIDVVFADCAATAEQDEIEAHAITSVFGPRGVPVAACKALMGRLGSGGPPLDVVLALLSIRHGVIPPSGHHVRPDPRFELDLVTASARTARIRRCLVLARGKHGFNAALVVCGPDEHHHHHHTQGEPA
jgi:act minimal PKS chain-length factor (CLF/KS beta)